MSSKKLMRYLSLVVSSTQRASVCFREHKVGDTVQLLAKASEVDVNSAMPHDLVALLEEFANVFPDALPEALPPSRAVDFDVVMKDSVKPQASPPSFRLSHMEQKLLDKFVDTIMGKGWVQVSNSLWVANVFGVPKRSDDGSMVSRTHWLRMLSEDTPVAMGFGLPLCEFPARNPQDCNVDNRT
ncbi:Aste57867_23704 [Aphanomyces stellatus]|uniref:Aste57867_23704 protein n=1 Tax=Aphanomyces stellatus TaxID=120398 RepID=A0A485LNK3_9STRA|nr:hypothetical protein As57867_023632 [Aphanomyces stellatus]VFU00349.1 Aste57867_23704 [Aphanomyces stellatus]